MSIDLDPSDWLLNYDPAVHDGNRVTPLIDGASYFAEIGSMLDSLGQDDFFYYAGWAINSVLSLDYADPTSPTLLDRLSTAAVKGVKVRFLLYKGMHQKDFDNWWHAENANQTHLQFLMIMNGLGHEVIIDRKHPIPEGSHHSKFVIAGKQDAATGEYVLTGYVGGIDLDWGRWATPDHTHPYTWHDIQFKVEGPIVYELLTHFEGRWAAHPHEVIHQDGQMMKTSTSLALATAYNIRQTPLDTACVQHLFTYPCAPANLPEGRTQAEYEADAYYPFVPRGMRTIEEAICHAIRQARVYIYIENYAFYHHGIAAELAARLEIDPALTVIYIGAYKTHAHYQPDTYIAYNTVRSAAHGYNFKTFDLRPPGRLYRPPDPDYPDENYQANIYPHSKVMIVDDRWATVGSANFNYRSMTTDGEVNIGFVDKNTRLDPQVNRYVSVNVRAFRRQLWAEHLEISASDPRLEHMVTALETWDELAQDVPHTPSVDPNASQARVFRQDLALRRWRYYSSPGSYYPVWDWYIDPQTQHPTTQ